VEQAPVASRGAGTRRRLGLPSASALVVANMIGVGVFTTSGFALGDLGRPEPVLLAWLVGGLPRPGFVAPSLFPSNEQS
jgi:hypothetical protein